MNLKIKYRCPKCRIGQDWKKILEKNCCALFQTSLLISADRFAAEAAFIESLDELDMSRGPDDGSGARLESAVVMRSIAWPESRSPRASMLAQSMLQSGLRPVAAMDRLPRICFVLRILLGYSADACARLLDIRESDIGALLESAALQLVQQSGGDGMSLSLQKTTVFEPST